MAKKKLTAEIMDTFAKDVKALFDSFLRAGFTTEQAFVLTTWYIQRD